MPRGQQRLDPQSQNDSKGNTRSATKLWYYHSLIFTNLIFGVNFSVTSQPICQFLGFNDPNWKCEYNKPQITWLPDVPSINLLIPMHLFNVLSGFQQEVRFAFELHTRSSKFHFNLANIELKRKTVKRCYKRNMRERRAKKVSGAYFRSCCK